MSRYRRFVIVLAVLVFVGAGWPSVRPTPARAAGPWYVTPSGNDSSDCLNALTPCATINGAIGKASSGDTINVATGTYTNSTGSEVVLIDKDLTLSGGWDATFTTQSDLSTIDGEGARGGIQINGGVTTIVERFVIQNTYGGSGIWNAGGTLTLNNSTVRNATGFGISNSSGGSVLAVNNSTVSNNTSIGIYNGGTLTLTQSSVNDNLSTGIVNYGTASIFNSAISDNNAPGSCGGGIYSTGTATLNNSTVSGNTAGRGGGIDITAGTMILNNSTVSNNTAEYGGGVEHGCEGGGGILILNNSTVSNNMASIGGGIYGGHVPLSNLMRNSILAGNAGSSPDCSDTISSQGYNLIGDTSGCDFTPGTGDLLNVDAQLGLFIGMPGYYPLLITSPAIDAGDPAGCMGSGGPLTTDQRGAPRVGTCDIGAYEYTSPGPAALIETYAGTPQRTPPFSTFGSPLQVTVLDSLGSPVPNASITFTAPASGPSGTFIDSGMFTTTALSNVSGLATPATFTANGLEGSYTVTATTTGVITQAVFLLSNTGWYAATSGNDASDCQTPATPCATLTGMTSKPGFMAGDTVLVASGTYTGTNDSVVTLDTDIRLVGGWNVAFTAQDGLAIIDGEGVRRGLTVNLGLTAIVEHFQVQNGYASNGHGGGIVNIGTLMLNDSMIVSSTAIFSGGGLNNQGHLTLNRSIISNNMGGGFSNNSGPGLLAVLNDSLISDNLNYRGVVNVGILTINHSTIRGNVDGGLYNGGTLNLIESTVSDNLGSGIYNSGLLVVNNTTISGNASPGDGGGLLNDASCDVSCLYGVANLNNVTIANNTADSDMDGSGNGGGLYNGIGSVVNFRNTLIAGNTDKGGQAPDCSGTLTTYGYDLLQSTVGCTLSGTLTGVITNAIPLLGSLQDNSGPTLTHALLSSSPAINAGNPAGCTDDVGTPLPADQRGWPRIGPCDIGAYEYFATKQVAGSFKAGGVVTYTISLSNLGGTTALNDVVLTDTLPISVTYMPGSFTATSGVGGESGGVITWTGSILTDTEALLTFAASISPTLPLGTVITNTALVSQGGVTVNAPVAFQLTAQIFLPLVRKDPPPNLVWYVAPGGNDANDCLSPVAACASINSVLGKASFQAGNSIRVAAGTYTGSGLQVVYLNKSASVSGGWDAAFTTQNGITTIDGQNARRGVLVEYGATVTLDRLVIQNGRVVAPFYYGQGGGILNYGTLTVTNSTISNNFVGGTEFGEGAGIFNGGTLTVINSTISGNTSTGTSNYGRGGGIQNYYTGSTLTLNNVTISNNTSDVAGGLFIFGAVTTTVQNSIIAGNTTTTGFLIDCEGALLSLGYTLIGSTSGCGFTSGPGDLLNVSPNLGPLQDNGGNTFTHALLLGSPAIDAANPATPGSGGTTCAATDQRGVARPQGVRCDMGAYESN